MSCVHRASSMHRFRNCPSAGYARSHFKSLYYGLPRTAVDLVPHQAYRDDSISRLDVVINQIDGFWGAAGAGKDIEILCHLLVVHEHRDAPLVWS